MGAFAQVASSDARPRQGFLVWGSLRGALVIDGTHYSYPEIQDFDIILWKPTSLSKLQLQENKDLVLLAMA